MVAMSAASSSWRCVRRSASVSFSAIAVLMMMHAGPAADQVQQREQEDPDDVDQVPVKPQDLHRLVVAVREPALLRQPDERSPPGSARPPCGWRAGRSCRSRPRSTSSPGAGSRPGWFSLRRRPCWRVRRNRIQFTRRDQSFVIVRVHSNALNTRKRRRARHVKIQQARPPFLSPRPPRSTAIAIVRLLKSSTKVLAVPEPEVQVLAAHVEGAWNIQR